MSADSPFSFLPILAANLLPLAGVLSLGWDAGTLAFIYCVEILFTILLAGVKAMFAQQPPTERDDGGVLSIGNTELAEKRGSVELVEWLPPVYPRNVPFAADVFGGVAWVSVFFFAFLSPFIEPLSLLAEPVVGLSILALIGAQVTDARRRYIGDEQYATVSPYAVVDTPLRQAFVLSILLIGIGVAGVMVGLTVIVVVKILIEWAGFRDADDGLLGWITGPGSTTSSESIDVPVDEPTTVIRPDRRAVLLTGTFRALVRAPWTGLLLFVVWLVLLGTSGLSVASPAGIVATVLLFGVFLPGAVCHRVFEYYLTYGTMGYQRRGDTLVAYDTLVESSQWAGETGRFRNVKLLDGYLADRVYDTRTIRLQTIRSDEERRLAHVEDPDLAVDVFDLPVFSTDLDPINRVPATVAVFLGVGITAGSAAILFVPGMPGEAIPYVFFLFPPATLLVTILWKLSYPDDLSELASTSD